MTFSDLKIGGSELHVQVVETAICNGMIIKNPSSTLDTKKKNVQWIIRGIDNSLSKEFSCVWFQIGNQIRFAKYLKNT
ncbi:hypothetical protein H311_02435 [Anncaliia algerae PRA109]|nr:hypothetical protein H311_02435 [Anncaliia algerae PRA109]